ncbi:MAG: BufA1 family periplasmic bufferin-type metallophore [Acidiferrobacter sp.]
MNKREFLSTAAASMLAVGALATSSPAHAAGMEQCFGVATAGHNDCVGISGLHSCKGQSTVNYDPGDFKVVPTGTCRQMGGLTEAQARVVLKDPAAVKAFEVKMKLRAHHP